MPTNASLGWRRAHAGVRLRDINQAVDRMVGVARRVKDLNGDGEVQRSELAQVARPLGRRLAQTMEAIRSGSGFYARDAVGPGNPYFSHQEFIDDYRDLKAAFRSMDGDHNGRLDEKELRRANSRMRQAVIEFVDP